MVPQTSHPQAAYDPAAHLQEFLDLIPGGVVVYRTTEPIEPLYFSAQVPALFGMTEEEYHVVFAGDPRRLIHEEDRDAALLQVKRCLREGVPVDLDLRVLHKSGQYLWINMNARQIRQPAGCPLLYCALRDITARRESEAGLLDRYQSTVRNFPGGLVVYAQGPVRGLYTEPVLISDGMLRLCRIDRAGMLERQKHGPTISIHPDDRPRVQEKYATLQRCGDRMAETCRILCGDGS